MRHLPRISAFVLFAALTAACSTQKEPAEAATKAAREALNTVNAPDMRYAAAEAKAIRDSVENAEAALARAAYPLAIQEASGVPERVAKLQETIAARKAELTESWTKASAAIPPFMTQITNRVKNARGAAGDQMRADLSMANSAWTEAMVASQSGDVGTAAAKAGEVKNTLVGLAGKLKVKIPAELEM